MPEFELAEVGSIQRELALQRSDLESLSGLILTRLLLLKERHPKTIRVIFSRQPRVKDFNGILRKLELIRKENKRAHWMDVNDIIALTIICPYESDIQIIYGWVKEVFVITPSFNEGIRDAQDGHRGYHFSLKLQKREYRAFPSYKDFSCELQIKTILQEAFDAKSHDLSYKNNEVGAELKRQFFHLSGHLRALDGQSEFLKDLILREKREFELRRTACLQVYVKDCGDVPTKLNIDLAKLPELPVMLDILEAQELDISKNACKFYAYCAISYDNDYLRKLTLDSIERYVDTNESDERRLFGRGALRWILGQHDAALADMETILENLKEENHIDNLIAREARNNYVYFVCDWQIFNPPVQKAALRKADAFAKELQPGRTSPELDTLGLYKIVFSDSVEEIDQGRMDLSKSLAKRKTDTELYKNFFELHQYIAVNRMLHLMTKPAL